MSADLRWDAHLRFYDADGGIVGRVDSMQVPAVGDIVWGDDNQAYRVVVRQWSTWPHPNSMAYREHNRGPMVDLRCEPAEGIWADQQDGAA